MQRHPTDPVSLVFGAVFAGAGALLAADRVDLVSGGRWAWPLLLIVIALAMLASARPWSGTPAKRGRQLSVDSDVENPPARDTDEV
jgi:hypothetical protein